MWASHCKQNYKGIWTDIEPKVVNIADNATNMISVFSLQGFSEITNAEDEDVDSENNDLYSLDDSFEIDFKLLPALTTEYNSWFAHTLLLVVKDDFEEAVQLGVTMGKVSR